MNSLSQEARPVSAPSLCWPGLGAEASRAGFVPGEAVVFGGGGLRVSFSTFSSCTGLWGERSRAGVGGLFGRRRDLCRLVCRRRQDGNLIGALGLRRQLGHGQGDRWRSRFGLSYRLRLGWRWLLRGDNSLRRGRNVGGW